MKEFPHVPAAFINAIADEGSKKEAVEWLQKTWNELCAVKAELTALRSPPSPVGGLLEADIIRDQSAFLRQAVPKKYHDFFDRLCRTALRSESGRAGVIEECARVCDRLAKLTSDAAYIGLEMAAKEIRALKSAPGNENAVPQAQDNAGDGSDASSQTRYKPAGTAPDPTKGAAELSREQIEEIRKEFRCIPVEQDELNTLCDMALRGGRGDGLIADKPQVLHAAAIARRWTKGEDFPDCGFVLTSDYDKLRPLSGEQAVRDAARYRWLRSEKCNPIHLFEDGAVHQHEHLGDDFGDLSRMLVNEELDAAIDAALRGDRGDGLIAEVERPAKLRITELLRDEEWHQLSAGEQNQRRKDAANTIEACIEANDLLLKARPLSGERVRVPREPTMGQWDDFCAVHHVPFDKFIAAYKAMLDAALRGEEGGKS